MHFLRPSSSVSRHSKWNDIGNKFLTASTDPADDESYEFDDDDEIDTASVPSSPLDGNITIVDLYAAMLETGSDGESTRPDSASDGHFEDSDFVNQSDASSMVSIDMNNNPKDVATLMLASQLTSSGVIGVGNFNSTRRRVSTTSEHTLFTVASFYDATMTRLTNSSRRSSLVGNPAKPTVQSTTFDVNVRQQSTPECCSQQASHETPQHQSPQAFSTSHHASTQGHTHSVAQSNQHQQPQRPVQTSASVLQSNISLTSTSPSTYRSPLRSHSERRRSFGQQSPVTSGCNSLTCAAAAFFSMTLSTLALGAIAALLVFQNHALAEQANNVPKVCQTDSCRVAGRTIHESINYTVNPCDDFFEYACGNWNAKHPIPDDKSRVGSFSGLAELVDKDLRTAFDEAVEKKRADPNAFGVKAINYALDVYTECLDRDSIKALGVKPIVDLSRDILQFDWPVITDEEIRALPGAQKSKMDAFKETFLRLYHIGLSPVFTFVVTPDANNTKVRVFDFDRPGFSLGRKEYENIEQYADQVKYFKEYVKNVATHMAGSRLNDGNRNKLDERLQEMFEFERKMALASTPEEGRRSTSVWYNRMNFDEFETLTENRYQWAALINKFLGEINASYRINGTSVLILDDIPYYQKLWSILEETPIYVLQNYLGFNLVSSQIKYTEGELREISLAYSRKVRGVQKLSPLWQRCVSTAFNSFSFAISRLYVEKFVSVDTKTAASSMIVDLKEAFRHIVEVRGWLDEPTRVKALEKLEGIRDNVAYPDWLMNDKELDIKYGFDWDTLDYKKGRFLANMMKNSIHSMKHMYYNYLKPVDNDKAWPMPPAMVNAAYMPTQNSITIPVGILQPPFFDAGRPAYMNYGAIGAVIGHEITHGFDDQGAQFDKSGNIVNWWTESTQKNFAKGSGCFVDQYGSITDAQTGKKLNGVNTQGENIADNGGVAQAFKAFESYAERNSQISKVPYLENFTNEQVFFLGYASVWCGHGRDQFVKNQIDYDPHSPVKYRVNTVLQNSPTFSKTFNCPVDSSMNLKNEKRCTLW